MCGSVLAYVCSVCISVCLLHSQLRLHITVAICSPLCTSHNITYKGWLDVWSYVLRDFGMKQVQLYSMAFALDECSYIYPTHTSTIFRNCVVQYHTVQHRKHGKCKHVPYHAEPDCSCISRSTSGTAISTAWYGTERRSLCYAGALFDQTTGLWEKLDDGRQWSTMQNKLQRNSNSELVRWHFPLGPSNTSTVPPFVAMCKRFEVSYHTVSNRSKPYCTSIM